MTDRRASFEGHLGRPRQISSESEGAPGLLESIGATTSTQPAAAIPRRRPLRASSLPDNSTQPNSTQWVDADKREPRKAKAGRNSLRKAQGLDSPNCSTSPTSSALELETSEKEKDTVGFLPRLSRILEGKESKAVKRRKGSTVSSIIDDYTPARQRRRTAEDAALGRRTIRQKHGSLQRRAESLANLPNPSLVSVLSGFTQQSSASSGSNSTVTQKSFDKNHVSKRKPPKDRKRIQTKQAPPKKAAMDPRQSSVFQYMSKSPTSEQFPDTTQNVHLMSHTSTGSASSSDSGEDEGLSSNAEESHANSPMTSPASARMSTSAQKSVDENRKSDRTESHHHDRFSSDSGISVRESSPESLSHMAAASYRIDTEEHSGGEHEEEEHKDDDTHDDDFDDGDDDENASSDEEQGVDEGPTQHLTIHRSAPPRIPSASSSRHSDPHTRRLRGQEQELRDHVLQPQPHRDFRFEGRLSPASHASGPVYDMHAHSGGSPSSYYVPAPQPPVWAPPPPAVGYYSPTYAPPGPYPHAADTSYAHPPMAPMAPSTALQQPPFYAQPQPPHYQVQPTGPDLTQTTLVGYELLAGKLSEGPQSDTNAPGQETVVPMYRKFEQLNHRVLLHLQDEIAELEEELRYTDECIAQVSPRAEAGQIHPASRRGEARYGSELHYRRTDLLGRIFLKLGQYNQALSSFSGILKSLDPADTEDIQSYRAWLEKHAPIEATEARFLEHKNDLLEVSRRRSGSTGGGAELHKHAALGLPLIAILPLMAFAIVPSLLGRLFIITLIGTAEVWVVTTSELIDLMTIREWVVCASIYFGLMALLAGVVP